MRLLWMEVPRNGAAPSATAILTSVVVAHESTKPIPSTPPAPGPNKGTPTVRVRRYSTTMARLPPMPTSKTIRVGQTGTSGA